MLTHTYRPWRLAGLVIPVVMLFMGCSRNDADTQSIVAALGSGSDGPGGGSGGSGGSG
ncbi:MAG: cytochrome d ubiquinol oxidase subunit II, partial [Myxococcales bacterium]|nr:cytochrome d ubiquinol oxidase subunit II [Myxococcales bacterium]